MEFLSAIAGFFMWLFGVWDEHQITVEQCHEAQSIGAVPYPMTQQEYERLEKCKAILEGDKDE